MIFTKTERLLLQIGLFSRLALFCLQILANLLPDHKARAFDPPPAPSTTSWSHLDAFVRDALLGGAAKWDSLHFLQVAEFGYLFETDAAFFPGFPLVLRGVDRVCLCPLLGRLFSPRTRLLLGAVLVNNAALILAGVLLYRLGRRWQTSSPAASFLGVVFFYFNPASIFFSVAYSESLFFLTIVGALTLLYRRRLWAAASLFALAGALRSNAVVFVGFFLFLWLNRVYGILGSSHYGTKPGHFETSEIHFPTSEGVSERANK